jgi:radical SAM peptide maturase (CXXX-repeat target family)
MVNYLPPKEEIYRDMMFRLFPEQINLGKDVKEVTFQVTEDCCLKCTYCYQLHKTPNKMSFDTAKKAIDDLLSDKYETLNRNNCFGIVVDFIGGEPFMEIELIQQICDYFFSEMIRLDHPWLFFTKLSLCSNGILYHDKRVQRFLDKYGNFCFFSVSIDGNKELHDACRIDHEGKGSYDRAIDAVKSYYKTFKMMPGTKMTLSPYNIQHTFAAVKNLMDLGYEHINLNCVYEKGWEETHANILYYQLKQLADYIIDNDLYNVIDISMFEEINFKPMPEESNENWCGGVEEFTISIDYKGDIFRCIRYMESSLNGSQKPLIIGNVERGIGVTEEDKICMEETTNITRRSQSTDECFYCPIAQGCGWCSAYNYQETGTVNKRVTYICVMHKASSLGNAYFWNRVYRHVGLKKRFKMYLPEEEILKIISEEEYQLLKTLEMEDE